MKPILPLVAFLLFSCGKETRFDVGQNYVQEFEAASRQVGRPVEVNDLIIEEGEFNGAEARCLQGGGSTPIIQVSRKRWERADHTRREIILFHEMGHCVLNREHIDTRGRSGAPVSIMHSYAVATNVYLRNRSYYLQELFSVR